MKKRTSYIIVIIVVALVIGGFSVVRYRRQNAASEKELITSQIGYGDFNAVNDETGTVYADQSATLYWQTTGVVGDVAAALGQEVEAEQVLAGIREDSLPQSYYMAQQELIAATNALQDLYDNAALVAASAQVELANAWSAVYGTSSRWNAVEADESFTSDEIEAARARVTIAEDELEKQQDKYDDTTWDVAEAKALLTLIIAQNEFDQATWYLDWLIAQEEGTDIEIEDPSLAVAIANLEAAQKRYEEIKDGPDPDDIRLAEARIAAAQASLDTATITAPFNGVITSVEVIEGDLVLPNTMAFRIDDLANLMVDVRVSEVDINQIQEGQPVLLEFDAIQDKVYNGEVKEVSPVGAQVQGLVSFKVSIRVTDADEMVKPGLTAAVQIIVDQIENALLIPNRAVRWYRGQQVVYLSTNGENPTSEDLVIIPVVVGASSDEFTELVDGEIEEGDWIVLNPPSVSIFDDLDPSQGPPSQFR